MADSAAFCTEATDLGVQTKICALFLGLLATASRPAGATTSVRTRCSLCLCPFHVYHKLLLFLRNV
jgi:hypothetical protein